jgi:hypothetical protein
LYLWERHLAATLSWLEAAPAIGILHRRQDSVARYYLIPTVYSNWRPTIKRLCRLSISIKRKNVIGAMMKIHARHEKVSFDIVPGASI